MNPILKGILGIGLETMIPGGSIISAGLDLFLAQKDKKETEHLEKLTKEMQKDWIEKQTIDPRKRTLLQQKICAESQIIEVLFQSLERLQDEKTTLEKEVQYAHNVIQKRKEIESERTKFRTVELKKQKLPKVEQRQQAQWSYRHPFVPKQVQFLSSKGEFDLWNMIWLLSGQSISNPSLENPLHGLPQPIYTALINTLRQNDSWCMTSNPLQTEALYHQQNRVYRYYRKKGSTFFRVPQSLQALDVGITLEKSPQLSKVGQSILQGFVASFVQSQNYILSMLEKDSSKAISFVVSPSIDASFILALLDTFALIKECAVFFQQAISLPSITVHFPKDETPSLWREPLHHYLGVDPYQLMKGTNISEAQKKHSPFWVPLSKHIFFSKEDPPPHAIYLDTAQHSITKKSSEWLEKRVLHPAILPTFNSTYQSLNFFARRFFAVAQLKKEQFSVLCKLFSSQQNLKHLCILPTGYGKSLIYQLYACLVPRLCLVVSPLNSLIHDQVTGLHQMGMYPSVAAINSQISIHEKREIFDRLHHYRILYISPERLLIPSFTNHLESLIKKGGFIGGFFVDEAHCASEWGHDFRLSYLQLSDTYHKVIQLQKRSFPLLALTATAPQMVRDDVCEVLDIPIKNVEQRASSERSNFSFSFHIVPYDDIQCQREEINKPLSHLFNHVIPKTLQITREELWKRNDKEHLHSGIVFANFIRSRIPRKFPENMFAIKRNIQNTTLAYTEQLAVYGSTPPDICIKCSSPFLLNFYGKVSCIDCGHKYKKENKKYHFAKPENWAEEIRNNQRRFKEGSVACMIATKSFGMGIDKSNVRYVIHHGLSGSISSYYQEAGRAGRDNKHAHVALMLQVPHKDCRGELEERGFRPRCMDSPTERNYKCPYSNKGLCDYGIQSNFIENGFPDKSKQLRDMYKYAQKNADFREKPDLRDVERAVYRLKQIGFVQNYKTLYSPNGSKKIEPEWNHRSEVKQIAIQTFERLKDTQNASWLATANILTNEEYIKEVGSRLLDTIEKRIRYQRYVMLYRLLGFAEEQKCRRITLRSIFDVDSDLAKQDYKCGFCDQCVPTLEFTQTVATLPKSSEEVRRFGQHLQKILSQSNLQIVLDENLYEDIAFHDIEDSVLAQSTQMIELNPTALNAYFMAMKLSEKQQLPEAQGWRNKGIEIGFQLQKNIDEIVCFLEDCPPNHPSWNVFFENMPKEKRTRWIKENFEHTHPFYILETTTESMNSITKDIQKILTSQNNFMAFSKKEQTKDSDE